MKIPKPLRRLARRKAVANRRRHEHHRRERPRLFAKIPRMCARELSDAALNQLRLAARFYTYCPIMDEVPCQHRNIACPPACRNYGGWDICKLYGGDR